MKTKAYFKTICFILFISLSFKIHATKYYVATNGSNSDPGTLEKPFKEISYAVNYKMKPGDIVYVRGGVYKASTYIEKSGNATGGYITIKNYPGELPEINGWNGSEMSHGTAFGGGSGKYISYVRIEGFYITGFWYPITFNWCSSCNTTLVDNNTTSNAASNIKGSHIQIAYNVIYKGGQNGISINFTSDVLIERNVIARTGYIKETGSWSSGISLFGTAGNNRIDSNVSFHNIDVSGNNTDGGGIIVDLSYDGANGNVNTYITNNICFNNGGSGIALSKSSKITVLNNSTYNNLNTITSDYYGEVTVAGKNTYKLNNIRLVNNILYQKSGRKSIAVDSRYPEQISLKSKNLDRSKALQYKDVTKADYSLKTINSLAIDKGSNDFNTYNIRCIGYDLSKILKASTPATGEPSWYTHVPDVTYIRSKGGLKGCWTNIDRTQLNATDIGAIESAVASTKARSMFFDEEDESFEEENQLVLFPNPFENEVTISLKQNVTILNLQLFDNLGNKQEISFNKNDNNSYSINSNNLKTGIYVLKVNTDSDVKSYKIVKK